MQILDNGTRFLHFRESLSLRAIARQSRGNKIEIAASLALLAMTANDDAVTSGGISRYGDTFMETDYAQGHADNGISWDDARNRAT